jgi:hypothetical protein
MTPERLSAAAHAVWAMLLSLPLAACPQQQAPSSPPHPTRKLACALGDGADFAETCALEQAGALWVLTRPDGGFVRVKRTAAGAVTVDGFPRMAARRVAGRLELATGHDRYRLPW